MKIRLFEAVDNGINKKFILFQIILDTKVSMSKEDEELLLGNNEEPDCLNGIYKSMVGFDDEVKWPDRIPDRIWGI